MIQRLIAVAIGIAFVVTCGAAEAKSRSKRTHLKASYSQHHHYRHHHRYARVHGTRHRVARGTLQHYASAGMSTDRGCLTPAAKNLLAQIESHFGRVQLVSTCRRGATIAGSHHPSMHRYGMAFDFRTSNKAAVVRWLAANNKGGTMTYAHSDHIHADVGQYHFVSLAGQRSRAYASRSTRRTYAAARIERPAGDLAGGSGYSDGAPIATPRAAARGQRYVNSAYADGQTMVMVRTTRRGHVRHARYLVPAYPQGQQRPVHAPI